MCPTLQGCAAQRPACAEAAGEAQAQYLSRLVVQGMQARVGWGSCRRMHNGAQRVCVVAALKASIYRGPWLLL